MPTEPTEHDARELLARAAATIEVDDAAPLTLTGLPEPARLRWPLLVAAAAAVVLALSSGWLVATQLGELNGPPQPAEGPVVEREHMYDDDQMPGLIGYTVAEARRLLDARGLKVDVNRDNVTCAPEGTVVMTAPAPGAVLRRGVPVRLSVTTTENLDGGMGRPIGCGAMSHSVWALVRFARGLAGPPAFAPEVTLGVVGGETRTIAASAARIDGSWRICNAIDCHSALEALDEMLTREWSGPAPDHGYDSLYLRVALAADAPPPCGSETWSPDVPRNRALVLAMVPPGTDVSSGDFCASPELGVVIDDQGRISEVDLLSTRSPEIDADDSASAEASAGRTAAASAFVTWARGAGPAPDFADRVRYLSSGLGPRWNDEPEDRTGWNGCSGRTFPDCPVDPVAAVARSRGSVAVSPGRAICPEGSEVPEPYASATADVVRIEEPEPWNCKISWAVELWIDGAGQIYAVNLASPGAAGDDYRAPAAQAFYLWANGGETPRFADHVRLLYLDQVQNVIPRREVDNGKGRWTLSQCTPVASRCFVNVLGVVSSISGAPVIAESAIDACGNTERLPDDLAAARSTDLVAIHAPNAHACQDSWVVELWVHGSRIYAVDLVAAPDSRLVSN